MNEGRQHADERGHIGEPLSWQSPASFALTVTTVPAGRPSAEGFDQPPPRQLACGESRRFPTSVRYPTHPASRTGRLYHSLRTSDKPTERPLLKRNPESREYTWHGGDGRPPSGVVTARYDPFPCGSLDLKQGESG